MAELVHATAISARGRGALIRGPSGSGKSDLALRCLALGPSPLLPDPARLVSDDQVLLEDRGDGGLWASAPATIHGLIEVRGIGIVPIAPSPPVPLFLIVDLVSSHEIERLPSETEAATLLGHTFPRLKLNAFEASAHVKLILALTRRTDPEANLEENPLR